MRSRTPHIPIGPGTSSARDGTAARRTAGHRRSAARRGRSTNGSGEYYLHFFAPEQPDLDWHVESVRRDFEGILRFWLDRGVDGFRVDVAHALFKAQDLREMDEPVPRTWYGDWLTALDQPELHDLYRDWRRLASEYPGERMFVGEIVLRNQESVARYVRPDELQLAFNFAFLNEHWDAEAMKATIDDCCTALGKVGAPVTWVLENHDVDRLPTRLGGGERGIARARAAAFLLLALPGTAFLYQGQELGLEEVELPDDARQDPIFFRTGGERLGRDGCRVPLPWQDGPPGFGFKSGKSWLPMPESWRALTVAAQTGDRRSNLELYRAALALRPRAEPLEWRESGEGILDFTRGNFRCIVNVNADDVPLPGVGLLLASDPDLDGMLPPDTSVWLRT